MATVYKVLGQVAPTPSTATTLYTVPAATSAVISTITVANLAGGSLTATIRIAVRPAGATLASLHYIAYDVPIAPGASAAFTLGLTLAATDVVTVYTNNTATFAAFGSELS
jgi:hypothetical protein